MNCKPGDLAIYVKSHAGNEGKIVRCLRPAVRDEIPGNWRPGPVWRIDRPMHTNHGNWIAIASDECLRPIRDNDGDDETLTWAGKPEEVTA